MTARRWSRAELSDAASGIRAILDLVERGELRATPIERRRLEGAWVTLRELAGESVEPGTVDCVEETDPFL